jgi:hypothetical protein
MGAGKDMAEAALIATSAAACLIPDAWAVAAEMYKAQCDPDAMIEAATAWFDTAGELNSAVSACEDATNSVAGTGWEGNWQGHDADAFTKKAAQLSQQMMVDEVLAGVVGVAVLTTAVLNYVRIVVMAVMALVLAIYAALILAAMASVVGNLGASESLEAEAAMFAAECEVSLQDMDTSFTTVERVLAGAIAAVLAGDAGIQAAFLGNHEVGEELVAATVAGLPTIATGLTARLYQNVVSRYMGNPYGNTLGRALGLGDTIFGSSFLDRADQPLDPVPHS